MRGVLLGKLEARRGPGGAARAPTSSMRVAALLAGGVDSSVALARACRAGHRVTAFYLKIWLEEELRFLGNCPWEEDLAFARATCARYGVPLEVVPLQQEYHREVVAHTLAELRRGHTPSPDLRCNRYIKLGAFADRWGGDYDCIVTGHYLSLIHISEPTILLSIG